MGSRHQRSPRGSGKTTAAAPGATIVVRCQRCKHAFTAAAEDAGESTRCPACGYGFEVPAGAPLSRETLGELSKIPSRAPSRVVRKGPREEETEVDIEAQERARRISGRILAVAGNAATAAIHGRHQPGEQRVAAFAAVDQPFPPVAKAERAPRILHASFRSAIHRARQPKLFFWLPLVAVAGAVGWRYVPGMPALGALAGAGIAIGVVLAHWGIIRLRTKSAVAVPAEVLLSLPFGEWRLLRFRWAANPAAFSAAAADGKLRAHGVFTNTVFARSAALNYARRGDTIWVAIGESGAKRATPIPYHLGHYAAQAIPQPFPAGYRPQLPCPKCRGRKVGNILAWPFRLIVLAVTLVSALNVAATALFSWTHFGLESPVPLAVSGVLGLVLVLVALAQLWPPVGCDACRLRGRVKTLGTWTHAERLLAFVAMCWLAVLPFGWTADESVAAVETLDRYCSELGLGADPDAPPPDVSLEDAVAIKVRLTALRAESGVEGEVPGGVPAGITVPDLADRLDEFLDLVIRSEGALDDSAASQKATRRLREARIVARQLHRLGRAAPTVWKSALDVPLIEAEPAEIRVDVQAYAVNSFDPTRALFEDVLSIEMVFWAELLPPQHEYVPGGAGRESRPIAGEDDP